MTFSTETRIIAHVADVDILQANKIGKFCDKYDIDYNVIFDREVNGCLLYTVDADVTGHSSQFYLVMDEMMK